MRCHSVALDSFRLNLFRDEALCGSLPAVKPRASSNSNDGGFAGRSRSSLDMTILSHRSRFEHKQAEQ
jgi:hypothetical protein